MRVIRVVRVTHQRVLLRETSLYLSLGLLGLLETIRAYVCIEMSQGLVRVIRAIRDYNVLTHGTSAATVKLYRIHTQKYILYTYQRCRVIRGIRVML